MRNKYLNIVLLGSAEDDELPRKAHTPILTASNVILIVTSLMETVMELLKLLCAREKKPVSEAELVKRCKSICTSYLVSYETPHLSRLHNTTPCVCISARQFITVASLTK